jgi:hypothetical protein
MTGLLKSAWNGYMMIIGLADCEHYEKDIRVSREVYLKAHVEQAVAVKRDDFNVGRDIDAGTSDAESIASTRYAWLLGCDAAAYSRPWPPPILSTGH